MDISYLPSLFMVCKKSHGSNNIHTENIKKLSQQLSTLKLLQQISLRTPNMNSLIPNIQSLLKFYSETFNKQKHKKNRKAIFAKDGFSVSMTMRNKRVFAFQILKQHKMKNTKQVKKITMQSDIESTLAKAGIDVSKRLIVVVKGAQNVDFDLDNGFVEFIKENLQKK